MPSMLLCQSFSMHSLSVTELLCTVVLQTDRNAYMSHVTSRNKSHILNYFLTMVCEHEQ